MLDDVKLVCASGRSLTRFGEAPRYAEGLYEIANGLYAWLVPNGSWGETNSGLITGDGQSLLVDTPWDLAFTRELRAAMAVVTDRHPVRTVVNTHSDGDHFWGNQYFKDEAIVASAAAVAAMTHVTPGSLTAFGTLGRVLCRVPMPRAQRIGAWFAGMTAPYDFRGVTLTQPNQTFTGELTLGVGGRTVVVRELGPAHTDGDSIVFVPDAGVLFAGDLLFVESTPPMWSGPPANWLRALDAILAYDARIIVPGHGPLTSRKGVLRMRSYLEFVSEAALKLLTAGVPPTAAASRILAEPGFAALGFLRWDSPERVVTTVHTLYRNEGYREGRPSALHTLRVLAAQAEVASALHDATPRSLHSMGLSSREATP